MLIFKLIYMVVALEDDKILLTLKGIKIMDKCQK
jgi:hypothetical protein